MHHYDVHKALSLNCEIHGPVSRDQALGLGQYGHVVKMYEVSYNPLFHYRIHFRKKLIENYDVQKLIFLNCEIRVPWVRDLGLRSWLNWPYCENVLNVRKSFSLLQYIFEINIINGSDVHEAFYLNNEIFGRFVKGSGSWAGPV